MTVVLPAPIFYNLLVSGFQPEALEILIPFILLFHVINVLQRLGRKWNMYQRLYFDNNFFNTNHQFNVAIKSYSTSYFVTFSAIINLSLSFMYCAVENQNVYLVLEQSFPHCQ
jgi:hypothetical protein